MHDSIWFHTIDSADQQALRTSDTPPQTAGVVVVGCGLIGLAIAYYLTEAGEKDVCILERGLALGEASGANAGGLWFGQQSPELGPVSSLAKTSSTLYDELGARFRFDLDRCGLLDLIFDQSGEIENQMAAVREAGFRVEKLGGKETRSLEPGLGVTPAGSFYYPDEGHVHPAKLGAAWVRHLRSVGVRICLDSEVKTLQPRVETSKGSVEAGTLVLATGAWTPLVTSALGWRPPIKPIRGTLLALEPMPKTLHHTLNGQTYYFSQLPSGPLIGGGSVDDVGFEQGVEQTTVESIREEMNRLVPAAASRSTAYAWSGFRPYSEDLKPVIGRAPGQEKIFVAAGHFKKGVMMAPVTGKIIADLVTQGKTDLNIAALDPARFQTAKKPDQAPAA